MLSGEDGPGIYGVFEDFAFDEVANHHDLDGKTRFVAILATLPGGQGIDGRPCCQPRLLPC